MTGLALAHVSWLILFLVQEREERVVKEIKARLRKQIEEAEKR